jgi:formylglycine-generating enzyme required for sulfatase activity
MPRLLGLVPLGLNPQGLYEFWHVLSGERPAGEVGAWELAPGTGLVFVLIPPGTFRMGAAQGDASPMTAVELPAHEVRVAAFLLSKYETTQAQWIRATGANPSEHPVGKGLAGHPAPWTTPLHPVEHVSFEDCERVARRWGLVLPTEAQFEYACRAGTQRVFGATDVFSDVQSWINFADQSFARAGGAATVPYDDGWPRHAPVGAFGANTFGVTAMLGNVWEWCRDWSFEGYRDVVHFGPAAEMRATLQLARGIRGGSFKTGPAYLRTSARLKRKPSGADDDLGVRFVIPLDG